jgi:hypothetical protein
MGHGLGPAQRAALAALAKTEHPWLSVPELAAALKLAERRARALVTTLEARELVTVIRSTVGWREGEGRLVFRYPGDDRPVALTLNEGDDWPYSKYWVAPRDGVEFVRQGMPVYGRQVWLPERRTAWEAEREAERAAWEAEFRALTGRR